MKVNYENNILEVPATGVGEMTLAFVSDTPIGISSTEGAGDDVNVGSISMSEEAEGIVSGIQRIGEGARQRTSGICSTGTFEKCITGWDV